MELTKDRLALLKDLEEKIGLTVTDKPLFNTALTHSSYAHQKRKDHVENNERLEFFGDAVLKLVVSEFLWNKYPHYSEGQLTKIRAVLISDKILARIGEDLGLGRYLLFGPTERAGGAKRPAAQANAMEAIFAAAYFDAGLLAARDLILRLLEPYVEKAVKQEIEGDWKSALQELVQHYGWPLPSYRVLREEGPQHKKIFNVEVAVQKSEGSAKTLLKTEGRGRTKKDAEQAAAQAILQKYFPLF